MSNYSTLIFKRRSNETEISRYTIIINDPHSETFAKEAALNKLIQFGVFEHVKEIVKDIWKPMVIREKALEGLTRNPAGNEEFLLSIINDMYSLYTFRKMALEGVIRSKSKRHLLEIINGIDTPEWARTQASKALQ
ncbi:MAG: hypothetical protein JSV20_03430 [Candidatus Bathyarchaeota archaeon]|nr:MAG: hypothetical protein JSV20_03430 [Candidatus Bathyarchaeota archaeon]